MKNDWNIPLTQIGGQLYFISNELASFDLSIINGSNIVYGISDTDIL